jgi:hypothetical protein
LACLQADVVFHSWDLAKELTAKDVQRTIRTLAIDCVITDRVNMAAISGCVQNPMRPLKKGLVDTGLTLEPLPVGWRHLKTRTDVDYTAHGNREYGQIVQKARFHQFDKTRTKYSYSSTSILRPLVTA